MECLEIFCFIFIDIAYSFTSIHTDTNVPAGSNLIWSLFTQVQYPIFEALKTPQIKLF